MRFKCRLINLVKKKKKIFFFFFFFPSPLSLVLFVFPPLSRLSCPGSVSALLRVGCQAVQKVRGDAEPRKAAHDCDV
jgi:hypothetical protein